MAEFVEESHTQLQRPAAVDNDLVQEDCKNIFIVTPLTAYDDLRMSKSDDDLNDDDGNDNDEDDDDEEEEDDDDDDDDDGSVGGISDLSDDPFGDDAHLLNYENPENKNSVEDGIKVLSLDEVPFDRDIRFVNVAVNSRPRQLVDVGGPVGRRGQKATIERVNKITSGNGAELTILDNHYKQLDILKRNFDTKKPSRSELRADRAKEERGGEDAKKLLKKERRESRSQNKISAGDGVSEIPKRRTRNRNREDKFVNLKANMEPRLLERSGYDGLVNTAAAGGEMKLRQGPPGSARRGGSKPSKTVSPLNGNYVRYGAEQQRQYSYHQNMQHQQYEYQSHDQFQDQTMYYNSAFQHQIVNSTRFKTDAPEFIPGVQPYGAPVAASKTLPTKGSSGGLQTFKFAKDAASDKIPDLDSSAISGFGLRIDAPEFVPRW